MIPANFSIAIENAALDWIDVTEDLESFSYGVVSSDQIIPTINLVFAADTLGLGALLDPELNPSRPRVRVTDGATVSIWLIEGHSGAVQSNYRYPVLTGRAYAGRVVDFRPLSYSFPAATCSQIAILACMQQPATGSGAAIPVVWSATHNPAIPAGQYQVAKKQRLEILREVAQMCGAGVRVSLDNTGFEVLDIPTRDLPATPVQAITDAISLSYSIERNHQPQNAVRVQGAVADYAVATLPRVIVELYPRSIVADGSSVATARARVFDATGRQATHTYIVEEPIAAGSYTEIPVTGCYSVEGVWLNTGTQESPVKGSEITPDSFTASIITVPTQSTQLFIVSYTQATQVSWTLEDWQDRILGEAQAAATATTVTTTEPIGRVQGVYRASDTNRTGTNYFTGGSATENTTTINLGISPGAAGTAVIIDYTQYNGLPLSASISPSSSLCNSAGYAETEIGSGTTLGTAIVTATALGVDGSNQLTLTGTDIASLDVDISPQVLRAVPGEVGETVAISNEAVTVANELNSGTGLYESYVVVAQPVTSATDVSVSGVSHQATRWNNDSDYRIYITPTAVTGQSAEAFYTTTVEDAAEDQTATITATLQNAGAEVVSDGTLVTFEIIGQAGGATLSADRDETLDGVAEVTLTAGVIAEFQVRVVGGPFVYLGTVKVVENPTPAENTNGGGAGTINWPDDDQDKGDDPCADLDQGVDGSIKGKRRLIDCEGEPHANISLIIHSGVSKQTDSDGVFEYTTGVVGENTGTASIGGEEYPFSWTITTETPEECQ